MESATDTKTPLQAIHHPSDVQLLDDIDRLRSHGISHLVALPQLVVCGDQSSGKSSVLEAISGIPFPTKDNLCTRFATEVVLRRTSDEQVSVTITPGPGREQNEAQKLQQFNMTLTDLKIFGEILEEAKTAMGVIDGGSAFTDDVLRIDISGPDRPHLTIVDLPRLIHSHNKFQSAEDIEVVRSLVQRYMKSSRSIILAVVSAKNDYANQIVLKMAREADPHGLRTLGIITKPDTLSAGSDSEADFVGLAKNEDVAFDLG
jgi:GTPase SAR1 family protein